MGFRINMYRVACFQFQNSLPFYNPHECLTCMAQSYTTQNLKSLLLFFNPFVILSFSVAKWLQPLKMCCDFYSEAQFAKKEAQNRRTYTYIQHIYLYLDMHTHDICAVQWLWWTTVKSIMYYFALGHGQSNGLITINGWFQGSPGPTINTHHTPKY